MTSPNQVAIPLLRVAALIFFCATSAIPQIRQINPGKLPQDKPVQHAYTDLLPIDQFARTSETTWRFPVPREQVTSRFLAAFHTLEAAQQQTPDNKELQLLTGLVAHLAYNLGIEEAYDPALNLLQPQAKEDFRAAWFLGIHQCQSSSYIAGMQQFLRVEASTPSLPGAFWQDYAYCAGVNDMPVHAVRAYDNARKIPDGLPIDERLEQTARDRINPSSVTSSYTAKQAWPAEKIVGGRHTSTLCGLSFSTKPAFHLNFGNVAMGTCPVSIDTEQYQSRYGPSSASLLLVTQVAKPGESLEAFTQRLIAAFSKGELKDPRRAEKTALPGIQCPAASCLTFEIVTSKQYKAEGGAHLLAVFFQSEQPAYPGLRFETPQPPPKVGNNSHESASSRPEEMLQRFNGTLYTCITLDANQDIYPRARRDFEDLIKSLAVDSK
jgi:hypothetical protein